MVETVRARCDRVVDGDTIDVVADLPLGVRRPVRLRLDGVDTAETYGTPESSPEDERGDEHTAFVSEWFEAVDGEAFPLTVEIVERGKYGRWIARVRRPDGEELTARLRERFPAVDTTAE
jgi:endonuclease YncB( thermonuclease family)